MLGSTAVGTETLKNLVLPGCGNITIVDDAAVSEADLGNNFFVTEADVGSSRAEVSPTRQALHGCSASAKAAAHTACRQPASGF